MTKFIQDYSSFVNKIEEEIRNKLGINLSLYSADLTRPGGYRPQEAKHLAISLNDSRELCNVYDFKTGETITIINRSDRSEAISKAFLKNTLAKAYRPDKQAINNNVGNNNVVSGKKMNEFKIDHSLVVPIDGQTHPYLIKKGVREVDPTGLFLYQDKLIVPLTPLKGTEPSAYQVITNDGAKFFETGSKTSGAFLRLSGNGKIYNNQILFYLCEGLATGLTIKKYMPHAEILVCTSCQNLKKVLRSIVEDWIACKNLKKSGLPATPAIDLERVSIIIAADNDHKTEQESGQNPGISAANYCLSLRTPEFKRIFCVYPKFKKSDLECSDWNDFMSKNKDIMNPWFLDHDLNHVNPKVELSSSAFARLYIEAKNVYRNLTPDDGLNFKRIKQTIIAKNSMINDIDEIEQGEIIFFEGDFYTKTPHTKLEKIYTGFKNKTQIEIPLWATLKENTYESCEFNIYDAIELLGNPTTARGIGVKKVKRIISMPWKKQVCVGDILNDFQHIKYTDLVNVNISSSVSKFDRLLGYVLGHENDDENIKWFKNWLAAAVQRPGIPLQKVPFIIGERGNGKSILLEFVKNILGLQTSASYKTEDIFDDEKNKFNMLPFSKELMVTIDEFEFKREYINSVKFLFGNSFIRVNTKHVNMICEADYRVSNVILAGNPSSKSLQGMDSDERFIVPLVNNYIIPKDSMEKTNQMLFIEGLRKEYIRDHSTDEKIIYNSPKPICNDLFHYFNEYLVDDDLLMALNISRVITVMSNELSVDEEILAKKILETKRVVLNRDDDFVGREPDLLADKIQWRENKKIIQKLSLRLNGLFLKCGYHKTRIRVNNIDRTFYVHQSLFKDIGPNLSKTSRELIIDHYEKKVTIK